MTEFTQNLLQECGEEVKALFTHLLNIYMKVGVETKFESRELRDLWFYMKIHELSDSVQRSGTNKELHMNLLQKSLDDDGAKINNPRYPVGSKEERHINEQVRSLCNL